MCFLGDVRVMWWFSLGDSHFQTNAIDDVENWFNYYLHIAFYVSHTPTSYTHHMQICVKHCTRDCVLINVAIQDYAFCDV